ncbi:hypothetical protein TTHERM_00077680 (macronuclear) [Tetrahymena thermophila SB210]|uniref:Uncharacterized protein n=1 Tax=Tetrahymena thermophila (strain SB210) TaxID=312017 RepID=Q23FZ6_TETTS|nr:hypothetical protein TTHERM_00077680 [Tetrahymena thermophila SB210]EAR95464.2 hypothetical protein TTHERM_00077680 [Tetrahymena thermophila SB210]|eukprot:XP_001015709.2 hypothetical protein TTHERM_00077680 [Tetrahymena thermophila SB210]
MSQQLQYIQMILKKQKQEINLFDFNYSIDLIEKLCKAKCSSVKVSEIEKKKCVICNQFIQQQQKQFCDCFIHEQCFSNYYRQEYENQMQAEFSSIYKNIPTSNQKIINCYFCQKKIFSSLDFIFKELKNQKCSHYKCKKAVGMQKIEYYCQCGQNIQFLHQECFIVEYNEANFETEQMKCQKCRFKMKFIDSQLNNRKQKLQYHCDLCQKQDQIDNQIPFYSAIICNCNKIYCQLCFSKYLEQHQQQSLIYFQDESITEFQCLSQVPKCNVDQRQLKQFQRTKAGKKFLNKVYECLNEEMIKNENILTCPGFYFRDKNSGKVEKQSAQKYITMKRQSEFDEDVKKEYQESLQKLQQKYEIIECNNKFQVDFQGDERIFKCSNCEYLDCRNQECKSPHFNLSCEIFKQLKQFKNRNQQNISQLNSNYQNAIYKVRYENQIIIVDQQFYNRLKEDPKNQIDLIEEIKNPFFQACNLPFDLFDPQYDKDWEQYKIQNKLQSSRGKIKGKDIQYNYPIHQNLFGYGINIQKLYGKQDNLKWLSRNTDEDTYIVGYHGTKSIAAVQGIIANGFQAGAGQAYKGSHCPYTNTIVGVGVYFGASINVAYGYTSPIRIQNQIYRIIFQCRLNSRTVKSACQIGTVGEYYVVNNPNDIKIYRILLIKEQ